MKKILGFMVMLVLTLSITASVKAQSAILFPLIAGDSINTIATKDTVFKVIPATAGYSAIGIQVVTTKISGTVAGKAYLYGSLDGVNYVVSDSSAAFVDQTTNVAQFTKSNAPFTYYQVQVRESGSAVSTQVNRVRVYYALKRCSN
jgi:hypothetical protein